MKADAAITMIIFANSCPDSDRFPQHDCANMRRTQKLICRRQSNTLSHSKNRSRNIDNMTAYDRPTKPSNAEIRCRLEAMLYRVVKSRSACNSDEVTIDAREDASMAEASGYTKTEGGIPVAMLD